MLNLFLVNKEPVLLENEIAVAMHDVYGDALCYFKSAKNRIDINFCVPERGLAVQVAYSLSKSARSRKIDNLVKLAKVDDAVNRLVIVTKEDEGDIDVEDAHIEVIPAWKFILRDLCSQPSA